MVGRGCSQASGLERLLVPQAEVADYGVIPSGQTFSAFSQVLLPVRVEKVVLVPDLQPLGLAL
jgi:hypothetical protein